MWCAPLKNFPTFLSTLIVIWELTSSYVFGRHESNDNLLTVSLTSSCIIQTNKRWYWRHWVNNDKLGIFFFQKLFCNFWGENVSLLYHNQRIRCSFSTAWKFHNFSITQILREISLGVSRNAKSAILTYLEALNLYFFFLYEFLLFLRDEIYKINKIQSLKCGKNGNFRTTRSS